MYTFDGPGVMAAFILAVLALKKALHLYYARENNLESIFRTKPIQISTCLVETSIP
jgi:hypothetical protein